MSSRSSHRTFWIDVEDLFQYFAVTSRPGSVQLLELQILKTLPSRAALMPGNTRVALVRHTGDDLLLNEVSLDSVLQLFEPRGIAEPPAQHTPAPTPAAAVIAAMVPAPLALQLRRAAVKQIQRLPPGIAGILLRIAVRQLALLRRLRHRPPAARELPPPPAPVLIPPSPTPAKPRFAGQAGDVFLVLGTPWLQSDYATLLRRLRTQYQMQMALLVNDLIPLRRPEWCPTELVQSFTAWIDTTLPQYDWLMAISQSTAADVQAYAAERCLELAAPVTTVPLGSGFEPARIEPHPPPPRGLPPPGSYALVVGTLEARRNHALLFRIWRRLLDELPQAQVPTLVFAGRVGSLVADLMQQLENAGWLGGKIRLLTAPADTELSALYRGCQFTLFPSLFEGWPMPVSESLALGRPCIIANRTALPEAGGNLARYFDPENLEDAYRTVRAVIDDPAGLAAWQQRVAREFRPVSWQRTADAILATCTTPDAAAVPVALEQAS